MKVGILVPGGVDREGIKVIPVLLWLLRRLADRHEVHVFSLYQEPRPAIYQLLGATVHNVGARPVRLRALHMIYREHRRAPFDLLHAFWADPPGVLAAFVGLLLRRPVLLHLAGGELVSLPDIRYGGRLTRRGRALTRLALRGASHLTAASEPMLEQAARLGFRVERLPLGVDLQRWPLREPRPRDP